MTLPFPEPTTPVASRAEVLLGYLDFFRSSLVAKLQALTPADLRGSRLPSRWAPVELLKHLTYVELRWLEWGFEGREVADPWGDQHGKRWFVDTDESLDQLVTALDAQAARSRAVVERHELDEIGRPGPRWDGADPASLERVLLHLVQEYARHLGQLDVVVELAGGPQGE